MAMEDEVVRHYGNAGIAERILAALRAVRGPEVPVTVDALAPLDHFHGGGVIATQALARVLNPQPGQRLIELGLCLHEPFQPPDQIEDLSHGRARYRDTGLVR